jgi:hypothetical protein
MNRTGANNANWRGGKTSHPLSDVYMDMVRRCTRANHQRWASYGGRGITVCARWRDDFWAFVEDMGPRPAGLTPNGKAAWTLDRIDNDRGYGPDNCRWADMSTQAKNRRDTAYPLRQRDTCAAGHPHSADNTRLSPDGKRRCRTCERQWAADARAKRRAA